MKIQSLRKQRKQPNPGRKRKRILLKSGAGGKEIRKIFALMKILMGMILVWSYQVMIVMKILGRRIVHMRIWQVRITSIKAVIINNVLEIKFYILVHKNPRKKVINSFDEDDEDNQCGDGKQEIHDDGEDRIESDDSDFKPSPPKLGKPAKAKQTTEKKKVVAKKPTEKKPKESGKPKATKTGGSKVTKAASKKKVIISDEEHDSQNKVSLMWNKDF